MSHTPLDPTSARRAFLWCAGLRWLPAGLVIPIFVLVLTERGLDLTQVGFVFAVYGGTTSLLELPTGGLADAIGRRPVLLIATCFDAVLALGFLIGTTLPQFLVVAALGAVGRALLSGPLESWYVDTVRAADPTAPLRPGLAAGSTVEAVALGAGALLSALLPILASDLPTRGLWSQLSLPLWAALVAQCASFAAVAWLVREPRRPGRSVATVTVGVGPVIRSAVDLALRSRDLRALFAWLFLHAVAIVAIEILWQPRFTALLGGVDSASRVFGFVIVGMSLAAAAGAWIAGRLPDGAAASPTRLCVVATALAAVSLLGMAAAGTFWIALAAFLFVYLWSGLSDVGGRELLHGHAPSATRSTLVSTQSLAGQCGNLTSSLVLARLADHAGIPLAWVVAAGVALAGALVVSRVRPASEEVERQRARAAGDPSAEVPSS